MNGFIVHTTGEAQEGNWTFNQYDQNLPSGQPAAHPDNTTTTEIWPAARVHSVRVSSAEHLDAWQHRQDDDVVLAGWELTLDNGRSIELRPRTDADHKASEDLVRAVLAKMG